jgi:hypothetical protein
MADTASLVARVKTEGVDQAARQLDDFSAAAAEAEGTASAYARAQAKAASEAKKSIAPVKGLSDITDQLGNKIAILEEAQTNGARSAAILAAQLKAGASASSEEVARIGDLTGKLYDLSNQQNKTVTTGKAANDGIGNFKNTAQQAGYQIQDLVVQLQGGTSAFVAIGQQGSQLAGAFGPGGAVLGAVIALASAVGGVLYNSLSDAEVSTKDLSSAQKDLQLVLQQSENGAYKAADAFARLIRQGASAAVINAKIASAQQATNTELKSFQQAAKDATRAGDTLWYGNAVGAESSIKAGQSVSSLNGYLDSFAKKMGVSKDEAKGLVPLLAAVQQKADAKNIAALAAETDKLSSKYKNQSAELVKLNSSLQAGVQASVDSADQQKALSNIVDETNKKQSASNDLYLRGLEVRGARGKEQAALERDLLKAQIKEREGLTDAERKRANDAADKQYQTEITKIEEREKAKEDREKKAEDKRAASASARAAKQEETQKKQAENFLNIISRGGADRLNKTDEIEKQQLEKLAAFHQQGLIVGQQYEQAKTEIMMNAEELRQQELDKRRKAQIEKEAKHDDAIAQIQALNATELELIDVQQKAKEDKQKEFLAKGIINEEEYQQSLAEIAENSDKKRIASYSDMLGTTTDNLRTALGEGNKMYKAFAIANAIMNTYQAAVAAYQSAAAIPIVGYIAGPVAAAAAVAAGLANVAKIRSAREQGGNLAAGQISTIAERGKAEVIMPAGASRVRTAQQMKQIMGENSNGSGVEGVTIINQTTGRIDSATTEQDDEGRIVVLIRETVSADMQNSNSSISKSRRATRGQPGYA